MTPLFYFDFKCWQGSSYFLINGLFCTINVKIQIDSQNSMQKILTLSNLELNHLLYDSQY